MRTRLDLLKPNLQEEVTSKQDAMVRPTLGPERIFNVNDTVLVRDYRSNGKWLEGTIVTCLGDKNFMVRVENEIMKRHVDQLLQHSRSSNYSHFDKNIVTNLPRRDITNENIDIRSNVSPPAQNQNNSPEPRRTRNLDESPVAEHGQQDDLNKGEEECKDQSVSIPQDFEAIEDDDKSISTPQEMEVPTIRRSTRIRKPVDRLNYK